MCVILKSILMQMSENNRFSTAKLDVSKEHYYGVRGVSQIKFTMSDPFLVLYDFDILSMIKRKNPLVFIVAFHFSNNNFDFQSLSRLICQMHF